MNPRNRRAFTPARAIASICAASAALAIACAPSDGVEPTDEPAAVTAYYVGVDDVGERGVIIDLTLTDTLYVFDERVFDADLTGVTLLCPNGVFMNFSAWLSQQISFGTVTLDPHHPGPLAIGSADLAHAEAHLDGVLAASGAGDLEAFDVDGASPGAVVEAPAACTCRFSCRHCPDGAVACSLRCTGCTNEEKEAWFAAYQVTDPGAGVGTRGDDSASCFGPSSECGPPSPLKPLPGADPSPIDDGSPGGADPGAGGAGPGGVGGDQGVGGGAGGPGADGATPGGGGEPETGGAMPGGGAPSGGGSGSGGSSGTSGDGSGVSGGGSSGTSGGGSSGTSGGSGGSAGQPW